MMRLTISIPKCDVEVIAEPVTIDGTDDTFAVHQTLDCFAGEPSFDAWTVTHVPTHMAVARDETIDGVIALARERWASRTPDQLSAALANARTRLAAMLNDRESA